MCMGGLSWDQEKLERVFTRLCQNWKMPDLESLEIRNCYNWKVSIRFEVRTESVRTGKYFFPPRPCMKTSEARAERELISK